MSQAIWTARRVGAPAAHMSVLADPLPLTRLTMGMLDEEPVIDDSCSESSNDSDCKYATVDSMPTPKGTGKAANLTKASAGAFPKASSGPHSQSSLAGVVHAAQDDKRGAVVNSAPTMSESVFARAKSAYGSVKAKVRNIAESNQNDLGIVTKIAAGLASSIRNGNTTAEYTSEKAKVLWGKHPVGQCMLPSSDLECNVALKVATTVTIAYKIAQEFGIPQYDKMCDVTAGFGALAFGVALWVKPLRLSLIDNNESQVKILSHNATVHENYTGVKTDAYFDTAGKLRKPVDTDLLIVDPPWICESGKLRPMLSITRILRESKWKEAIVKIPTDWASSKQCGQLRDEWNITYSDTISLKTQTFLHVTRAHKLTAKVLEDFVPKTTRVERGSICDLSQRKAPVKKSVKTVSSQSSGGKTATSTKATSVSKGAIPTLTQRQKDQLAALRAHFGADKGYHILNQQHPHGYLADVRACGEKYALGWAKKNGFNTVASGYGCKRNSAAYAWVFRPILEAKDAFKLNAMKDGKFARYCDCEYADTCTHNQRKYKSKIDGEHTVNKEYQAMMLIDTVEHLTLDQVVRHCESTTLKTVLMLSHDMPEKTGESFDGCYSWTTDQLGNRTVKCGNDRKSAVQAYKHKYPMWRHESSFDVKGVKYSQVHIANWDSYVFRVFMRDDAAAMVAGKMDTDSSSVASSKVIESKHAPRKQLIDAAFEKALTQQQSETMDVFENRLFGLEPRDKMTPEYLYWGIAVNALKKAEIVKDLTSHINYAAYQNAQSTTEDPKSSDETKSQRSASTKTVLDAKGKNKEVSKTAETPLTLNEARERIIAQNKEYANSSKYFIWPAFQDPEVLFGEYRRILNAKEKDIERGPRKRCSYVNLNRVQNKSTGEIYYKDELDKCLTHKMVHSQDGYAVYVANISQDSVYRPSYMPQQLFEMIVDRVLGSTALENEGPRLYVRLMTQCLRAEGYDSSWTGVFRREIDAINNEVFGEAKNMPIKAHTDVVNNRAAGFVESPIGWYKRHLAEAFLRATEDGSTWTDTAKAVAWTLPTLAVLAGLATATIVAGPVIGIALTVVTTAVAGICTVMDSLNSAATTLTKSMASASSAGACF